VPGGTGTLRTVLESTTMKTAPTLLPSPPDIPVRRYGTVPDLPDTVYEMETVPAAGTIADRGGLAVLLVALLVGGVGAWLLYF